MSSNTEFQLYVTFYTWAITNPSALQIDLYYTPQKSLKCDNIDKFCLYVSDEGMYQISSFYIDPKLRHRPHPTRIIKTFAACYKITQVCTLFIDFVCISVSDGHVCQTFYVDPL